MSDRTRHTGHEAYQHEIDNALLINSTSEVFMITSREPSPDSMMDIHHTSDPVKSEAIESILVYPKPQITQQEPEDLMRSVIEKSRVPQFVAALTAFVEVQVIGPIEFIQSVKDVFACVRVHNVEENSQAHRVSSVDQLFELFWGTVAGASGEETRYLVSKGYKIRVSILCDG